MISVGACLHADKKVRILVSERGLSHKLRFSSRFYDENSGTSKFTSQERHETVQANYVL